MRIGWLMDRMEAERLGLTRPGGLLGELTERMLESTPEGEIDGHFVCARLDPGGPRQRGTPAAGTGHDRAHRGGDG
jgi:hypothetical protein